MKSLATVLFGVRPAVLLALPLVVGALGVQAAVPYAPTENGKVPDAIVGKADAPQGRTLEYFPGARGYLAEPSSDGPHGAVILIHEWNGLVDRVRQTADAFAAEGYVALAADLYQGRTGSSSQENIALMQETQADPDQVTANLDAAAQYLKGRQDTNDKIAAIGWCFGGGIALSYALGGEEHEGTAIFYGSLLDDPEKLQHLTHEIYGTFAGQDERITPEHVDRFVAALRKVGLENDVHVYDPVRHGFWLHVDRDEATNLQPAVDAWQRLKAYLKRTLG